MSVKVQLKHSATANKAPLATDLVDGELAININAASPAAYIKDSAGAVVKLAGAGSVSTPDATTTSKGIVQLADPAGIAAGTAGLVVDAAQLKAAQATAAGSTTAPAAPAAGKVWVNSGVTPAVINVWNGSSWIPQVGATVTAPAAPTAPAAGQVWVNTSVAPNVASIWDGTAWAAAAPDGAAAAVLANDAKYATKAELAVENLWDRTGTVLSPATAGDGMAFGTDGLVYDAATKRLGIGTASPGSALDVVGEIRLTASIATSTSSFVYSYGGGSIGDVRSGINLDGSNHAITFLTDQLERARIDSSGRLLVGTSSTSATLTTILQGNSSSATSSAGLMLARGEAPAADGTVLGALDYAASNHVIASRILCKRDGGTWTAGTSQPTRLEFSTTADGASGPTERMRIQSDGQIGLFNCGGLYPNTDNVTGLGFSGFRWTAVYAANGTIQTSDGREKTEVAEASLGSNFIKALRPVSYKWIEGGKQDSGDRDEDGNYIYESIPGQRTHWGFIAQEVKEAVDAAGVDFGGWVLTDKDDPDSQQALRYDQFIAPLTKALQEALAKIETLEAKVAALEAS
jgi:hypothetical protein